MVFDPNICNHFSNCCAVGSEIDSDRNHNIDYICRHTKINKRRNEIKLILSIIRLIDVHWNDVLVKMSYIIEFIAHYKLCIWYTCQFEWKHAPPLYYAPSFLFIALLSFKLFVSFIMDFKLRLLFFQVFPSQKQPEEDEKKNQNGNKSRSNNKKKKKKIRNCTANGKHASYGSIAWWPRNGRKEEIFFFFSLSLFKQNTLILLKCFFFFGMNRPLKMKQTAGLYWKNSRTPIETLLGIRLL